MQFTREASAGNLIREVEAGRIRVGEQWLTGNIIVTPDTILSDWQLTGVDRIGLDDLAPALNYGPELVVIGAGMGPSTPDIDLMATLAQQGIGLEFMDTPAACRTYNVLVHEGRRVAAALVVQTISA